MSFIICSVKDAVKLMDHMDENDMVILNVINHRTYEHEHPRRIKKKKGEELIKQAEYIRYQDNDYFGTLLLHGVLKEREEIEHNILFPRME